MSLQYRNDVVMETTVGSAYTAGDPTLTVATGDGDARMPATGDFWVAVTDWIPGDAGSRTYFFILKISSRSGDVLTRVAGTDQGTSDHDASVGAHVFWVLSAGALAQLIADITASATPSQAATINLQTGTSYTLQTSDNGSVIACSNASAFTLTVPSGLGAGFNCLVLQLGAGQVTPTASGTTINQRESLTKTAGQYAVATLFAPSADTFVLTGDLA